MPDLVLHDHPSSSNCLKVRFLLAELGITAQIRHVPLTGVRPTWHTTIQPLGTVPVLIDDGLVIGDSNTILRYLAQREGRTDLYPTTARERAAVDWAIDLWAVDVRPCLLDIEHHAFWASDPEHGGGTLETADPAAVAAATPAAIAGLDVYERFLELAGGTHPALGSLHHRRLLRGPGAVARGTAAAPARTVAAPWRSTDAA